MSSPCKTPERTILLPDVRISCLSGKACARGVPGTWTALAAVVGARPHPDRGQEVGQGVSGRVSRGRTSEAWNPGGLSKNVAAPAGLPRGRRTPCRVHARADGQAHGCCVAAAGNHGEYGAGAKPASLASCVAPWRVSHLWLSEARTWARPCGQHGPNLETLIAAVPVNGPHVCNEWRRAKTVATLLATAWARPHGAKAARGRGHVKHNFRRPGFRPRFHPSQGTLNEGCRSCNCAMRRGQGPLAGAPRVPGGVRPSPATQLIESRCPRSGFSRDVTMLPALCDIK